MKHIEIIIRILCTSFVLMQVYKEAGFYTVLCFMLILLESMLMTVWRNNMHDVLDTIVNMTKKNAQHAIELLEAFNNAKK